MLASKSISLRRLKEHIQLRKKLRIPVDAIVSSIKDNGRFYKRMQVRHNAFWKTHNAEEAKKVINYSTDTLEKWKEGQLWQRKLSNKFNAREFAKLHGCKIPELYWAGRDIDTINFDVLPQHYVIKPTTGHSCQLIFLMNKSLNLMDDKSFTHEDLLKVMARALDENLNLEFIIEEFLKTEKDEYRIPVDYKFYMFNGEVATIETINRLSSTSGTVNYYDEEWNKMNNIAIAKYQKGTCQPAPKCLKELVTSAKKLSKSYETFVRIDFYATSKGAFFGEFCPTPGCAKFLTSETDKIFIKYWDKFCSGMI